MDGERVSLNELEKGLADIRKNFATLIEYQASWSILIKARYDALLKVGFDKKQALEIVKARGITG